MRFTFGAWLVSRLLIAAVFALLSPHPVAALNNWDGAWYGSIALHGYGFAAIGAQHDIAFFPLYPLLVRAVYALGIPWMMATLIVSNGSFLGALIAIDRLALARWDRMTARWCVACLCALPPVLFTATGYPEATFLFFSALALWFAQRSRPVVAVLAAAVASAASAIGIALGGALIGRALMRRRHKDAILAVLSLGGVAAFAAWCWWRFGDPLAFVHAQRAWRSHPGFNPAAWEALAFSLTSVNGFALNVMTVVLMPFGALLIVLRRRDLGPLLTLYGLFGLALIALSGEPVSAARKAYSIVPVLLAFGRTFSRAPRAGFAALGLSLLLLLHDAAAFAHGEWVG